MRTFQIPFHGHLDQPVNNVFVDQSPGLVVNTGIPIIIKERAVGYRFDTHFHPFVSELIKRLTDGFVRGLQAADTVYAKGTAGTLQILPDTIMVELATDLIIENEDPVRAGTPIALIDALLRFPPSNDLVSPTGEMVVTPQKGIRLTNDKTATFGSTVTLAPGTRV